MTLLILVSFIVLLTSALCSCTEASLFSVSKMKVQAKAQTGNKNAIALSRIQEDMSKPIAAIVIMNNIANITGSMFVGKLAAGQLGTWEGIFVGCFTFMVIICSEIIPKIIGERFCDTISFISARPVLFLTWILSWLIWILNIFTRHFSNKSGRNLSIDESEIRMMANLSSKHGVIDQNESVLISKVFELDDLTAGDIMTPRVMMTTLDQSLTLGEAKEVIMKSSHSRIVVIDEEPDEVVGMVFKVELLAAMVNNDYHKTLGEFAKKVKFVPEQATADNLLKFFQMTRQHLAIVTDQFSGVAGVVTLEDVLECLTGEIVDETDHAVDLQKVAKENRQPKHRMEEDEQGS